jgi:hypothetical protein
VIGSLEETVCGGVGRCGQEREEESKVAHAVRIALR